MYKFLKRKCNNGADQEEKPPENKLPKNQKTDAGKRTFGPKPQTASMKTVRKWEKELDIQLQYEVSQSDESVVVLIWCKVCKNYSRDKLSSVGYFLSSVKFGKGGTMNADTLSNMSHCIHPHPFPFSAFPQTIMA